MNDFEQVQVTITFKMSVPRQGDTGGLTKQLASNVEMAIRPTLYAYSIGHTEPLVSAVSEDPL